MRRSLAGYAGVLATVALTAGVYTLVIDAARRPWSVATTGVPPAGAGGGNVLQPLAEDLTWVYRARGMGRETWTVSVVGREDVRGEQAWLLEDSVGEPFALRYALVNRDGDLWTVAVDELDGDGVWSRTHLPNPQLWQPDPDGSRAWSFEIRSPAWITADRSMRAGGPWDGVGGRHATWIVESDEAFDGEKQHTLITVAEEIGPVEFRYGDGPVATVERLVELRTAPPPARGRFKARTWVGGGELPEEWAIELIDGGTGTVETESGRYPLSWARRSDGMIDVSADVGSVPFRWIGRQSGAGLLGRATWRTESFVLEFVTA